MKVSAGERLQSSGADTGERIAEALKQCKELTDHFARKANASKRSFALLRYSTIVLTVGIVKTP